MAMHWNEEGSTSGVRKLPRIVGTIFVWIRFLSLIEYYSKCVEQLNYQAEAQQQLHAIDCLLREHRFQLP
jgi:hypothetical protein